MTSPFVSYGIPKCRSEFRHLEQDQRLTFTHHRKSTLVLWNSVTHDRIIDMIHYGVPSGFPLWSLVYDFYGALKIRAPKEWYVFAGRRLQSAFSHTFGSKIKQKKKRQNICSHIVIHNMGGNCFYLIGRNCFYLIGHGRINKLWLRLICTVITYSRKLTNKREENISLRN